MKQYEDAAWRQEMRIEIDMNHMMADYAAESRAAVRSQLRKLARSLSGDALKNTQKAIARLSDPPGRLLRKNFIERREMQTLQKRLVAAARAVSVVRGDVSKMMAWTQLPYDQGEVVESIQREAERIRGRFDAFVVLGIGGSALGPIAVQQALCDLHHNELPRERRNAPKLYVEDNIDPERMVSLLNILDLENTCFNVITKSGNTSETMSQFLIVTDLLKQKFGDRYAEHIVVTTDATQGNLRKIADEGGLVSFVVPDGVGGRFSELSPVGLLAAAVAGVDINELLAGAAYMDERTNESDPFKNPALFAAGAMYMAMQKGLNIHVVMPYADSLKYFSDWYCQLWAESLGKNQRRDRSIRPVGQTPVRALGATDQHSQVQLYTEGPDDKVITFLNVGKYRRSITIPVGYEEFSDIAFLSGHTLGELLTIEQQATEYALLKAAKPSWSITLPKVNAFTLGQLMYFFEMMTAYAGELLDIDAFNQPGVEEGKNAAYAMMGREGYAEKQVELGARPAPRKDYIL